MLAIKKILMNQTKMSSSLKSSIRNKIKTSHKVENDETKRTEHGFLLTISILF